MSERVTYVPEARLDPSLVVEELAAAVVANMERTGEAVAWIATADERIRLAAFELDLATVHPDRVGFPWPADTLKADMEDTEVWPWPPQVAPTAGEILPRIIQAIEEQTMDPVEADALRAAQAEHAKLTADHLVHPDDAARQIEQGFADLLGTTIDGLHAVGLRAVRAVEYGWVLRRVEDPFETSTTPVWEPDGAGTWTPRRRDIEAPYRPQENPNP